MAATLTPPVDDKPKVEQPTPVVATSQPADSKPAVQPKLWVLIVGSIITLIGTLIVSFIGFIFVGASVLESRNQAVLFDQFNKEIKEATAPTERPVAEGDPVAALQIDKLGLNAVVVAGATSGDLQSGPGLRSDSVFPGQVGGAVIEGKRSTFGAPFHDLDQLAKGDTLTVTTGQGQFSYTVDLVRRSDESVAAPAPAASRLTLITSDPLIAPSRSLIVSAALTGGTAQPASPVAAPVAAEAPLTGNSAAALSLALWAQALVLIAVGVAYLWRRVSPAVLWIGATPLLIAVIWCVCASMAQLLPNTL